MRTAIKDATEKYYKKLSKIVFVTNPALGRTWLLEVCCDIHCVYYLPQYAITTLLFFVDVQSLKIERHWNLYATPELTLEKLQMIATTNASVDWKLLWLKWMNASASTREA